MYCLFRDSKRVETRDRNRVARDRNQFKFFFKSLAAEPPSSSHVYTACVKHPSSIFVLLVFFMCVLSALDNSRKKNAQLSATEWPLRGPVTRFRPMPRAKGKPNATALPLRLPLLPECDRPVPTGLVGTDGVVRDLDVAAIARLSKRERKTLLFVARAARRPPAGFTHVMPCKGRAAATILDLETRVGVDAALIIIRKDADDDKRLTSARHHARQLAIMVDTCNGSQRGAHISHTRTTAHLSRCSCSCSDAHARVRCSRSQ